MTEEAAAPFRFRIADISPVPDDDVLAAIAAALDQAWPAPTPSSGALAIDSDWRFGQRRWRARQIPLQTWGRPAR
ncbi:MAG: hypothetical protein ACI81L_001860 [Verrucomicrobiales bacterium]|jgi:hypothetical protein